MTCALCLRGYLDPVDDTNKKIFSINQYSALFQNCRGQNCPFRERRCCAHPMRATGLARAFLWSGHVASVPTSSPGPPFVLGEVTGEKQQVSAFASTEGLLCLGDTEPKGLDQEVQGQNYMLWKACDSTAYFSSWLYIHVSVTSKKLVNYLNSLL